jgi:hypothetical protein
MRKLIFALCFVLITVFAYAAETFVIPTDPENNITSSAKTFTVGNIKVVADMTRPAVPFEPVTFVFKFSQDVENVNIKFNMSMDMGDISAVAKKAGNGYTAKVTLPKCMMGGDTWFAQLNFKHNGIPQSKVFFFTVKK